MPVPNLFLVGAPRCGTTSLAHYLSLHPEIEIASVKEPLFHAKDLPTPATVTDPDRYLSLFGDGTYRMEASPWYLYSEAAAASIAEMSPEARIVIQLRDPCEQIASLHTHHRFVGIEPEPDLEQAVLTDRPRSPEDFRTSVDYLAVASFATQVGRYTDRFPAEQIHFVMLGDLGERPEATHLATLRFLGLPEIPLHDYRKLNVRRHHRCETVARLTAALGPRPAPRWRRSLAARINRVNTVPDSETLPRALRRRIVDALEPEIRRLDDMLDVDLSPWLAR